MYSQGRQAKITLRCNVDLTLVGHVLFVEDRKDWQMFVKKSKGPRVVTLPDGSLLSVADLPPVDTRWVASRKAIVLKAVTHGLIAREDAIRRYGLSAEEFDGWMSAVEKHGTKALKVTALQKYRQP